MNDNVFLIQHLQGYGGNTKYEENAVRFARAGFIRCRSETDAEGKYWEVWLGYPWLLKGELNKATPDAIASWIRRQGPGEITLAKSDSRWGLSNEGE